MQQQLTILIPVYNDWECVDKLLPMISAHLRDSEQTASVLLVDDGSQEPMPTNLATGLDAIKSLSVLQLARNLGHQRAICVGLCHLRQESSCDQVLIMDGDGEDDPADIPRLISALKTESKHNIIFAERTRRSEGLLFTTFYHLYRLAHRLLVGHHVRVGNFSLMNRDCLNSLCVAPELWNHFAACVFSIRQPSSTIKTRRAKRITGKSKMNFPSLVMHGLSAISVFSDRVSTRLLILASLISLISFSGIICVATLKYVVDLATPGWATTAIGTLLIIAMQSIGFTFIFCFLVLTSRTNGSMIPARDAKHFIKGARQLF